MSYDYRRTTTRRTNAANRPGRRSLYAPPPPPSRHGHGLLTFWIPLVVTGTIAIGGLAAWVWSEREHDEDESEYETSAKPPRPPPTTSAGGAGYSSGGGYANGGASGGEGPGGGTTYAATTTTATSASMSATATAAASGGEAAGYYDQSQSYREGAARTDYRDVGQQQQDESTWYGRVTGMMKRTPSPQQFFDGAAKQVTAGVGAVGGYLGGIMEEGSGAEDELRSERRDEKRTDERGAKKSGARRVRSAEEREGFSDHERWSEEAEEQSTRVGVVEAESGRRAESARNVREERGKGKAKKAIAIVISAETDALQGMKVEDDDEAVGEHPSILSHLPTAIPGSVDLFVLIYSPTLKGLPPTNYNPHPSIQQPERDPSSSPAIQTPASELQSISPRPSSPTSGNFNPTAAFDGLYSSALQLTTPTRILPFTTSDGYIHILRHLAPQLVYVDDALSNDGDSVAKLKGWVGHVVLVAGGGLVDTETEDEGGDDRKGKWYERSEFVGLGKDVEVVDAGRVGEDWGKRIGR